MPTNYNDLNYKRISEINDLNYNVIKTNVVKKSSQLMGDIELNIEELDKFFI